MTDAGGGGGRELWCGPSLRLLLVNMRHGADGAPSPYADLAPPPASIFTSGEALRKAAGPAPASGLCRDNSRPLNVGESSQSSRGRGRRGTRAGT